MKRTLICFSLLALSACSRQEAPPSAASSDLEARAVKEEVSASVQEDPSPSVASSSITVSSNLPSDAIALRRPSRPSPPAAGLLGPQTGSGEYASQDWTLPTDGATPSTEGLPPGADAPLVPRSRATELAQEARIIEELPTPDESARIVEDIPPAE